MTRSTSNGMELLVGFLCTLAMIGGTYLASPAGYAYASSGVVGMAVLVSYLSHRSEIPATVSGTPLTFVQMVQAMRALVLMPHERPVYLCVRGIYAPAGTVFAAQYDGQHVLVITEPEVSTHAA